jgi:cobalt/nickel transport system ATP-binding protein
MTPSGSPLVELHCGAHTYPDGSVGLHEVDFSVYPNEIVAVIGPNGAGKSTLLKHLNATLVPDDGELVVDGTPITRENKSIARREVGFVFQDPDTQLVAPTVFEDVLFGLQNQGLAPEAARQRAQDALETVEAVHLVDRIPHYLSGGEKRLVGLAGVLALDPSVLVLDEPLAGLDPKRAGLVRERIRDVQEGDVSVVLSTHDVDLAAALADRVVVVADGNTIGEGPPERVFYDDSLLAGANLEPPTVVRLARASGIAPEEKPLTEAGLLAALEGRPAVNSREADDS